MPPRATTKMQPTKGESRREEILAAAVEIFAEQGYERTSIEMICSAVGIARGTLYQYFGDKRSLFRVILETHANKILEYMRPYDQLGIELPSDPKLVLQLLKERIRLIFVVVTEHRHAFRILFGEALAKHADAEDLLLRFDTTFRETIAYEIRAANAAQVLAVDDPAFVANFILGALIKTAQMYIFDSDIPTDPAVLAERTTALIARTIL